jgi:hypothetical protein
MSGPLVCGLGVGLTTAHCKNLTYYEIFRITLDLD